MSEANEQDLRGLAAAYALGALDETDRAAFEAQLARDPELAREVDEYREVGALLALDASATPGPDLKARTIARAARPKAVSRPARRFDGRWLALAASLVVVVGLGTAWLQARRQVAQRDEAIQALQDSLTARGLVLARREATLNAILEGPVTLTRLTASGDPEPGVQLFWNRQTHAAIVHAFNLPPATESRVYQLWFIPRNGKPIPSVTFNSEPEGHALVEQVTVPEGVELAAAAITVEPAGGSPQPTTTPILVGALAPEKS